MPHPFPTRRSSDRDVPYSPGTIKIEVDATNLSQRIFKVKQTIPAVPGELTLLYPEWIPGGHSPRGAIDKVAGIRFSANGQRLDWRRATIGRASLRDRVCRYV